MESMRAVVFEGEAGRFDRTVAAILRAPPTVRAAPPCATHRTPAIDQQGPCPGRLQAVARQRSTVGRPDPLRP
jgi:hypothetical protein